MRTGPLMSLPFTYYPFHMMPVPAQPERRSASELRENDAQEQLRQHYRRRKIGAAAAGLLFMGAGCFVGALPAFVAWSLGYVCAAHALRLHRERLGARGEPVPSARTREIRDAVQKIWQDTGVREPEVYVHPGRGMLRSVRIRGGRVRLLVPLETADLPQQQFHALVYREAVRQHHRDPVLLGSVRAMKGAVNASRRYLMWMPVWIAGGGEWGFNVVGMVHAALGVAASPLYLGVLAGGIGMRCCQSVLGRYQELRADRDAAERLQVRTGRRDDLAQAIAEVTERDLRALSLRCSELGVKLAHHPTLGRVWNACAPRVVEMNRAIVEGRTRFLRAVTWGVRDHPPLRSRVEKLDAALARREVNATSGVLPNPAVDRRECTRVPASPTFSPHGIRVVRTPREKTVSQRQGRTQARDIGLD